MQALTPMDALSRFTAVVELLTSNRLTKANAFEHRITDCIDGLFRSLQETAEDNEMLWQKYSTGIDSCARVYSFCVDHLHSEIFKVLGGVTRTGQGQAEAVEEDEVKPGRVKRRTNASNTLENDEKNISLAKFEKGECADPYFKIVSSKFDVANSKGLLLNNLSVNGKGDLMMGEEDCPNEIEEIDKMTEVELKICLNLTEDSLREAKICKIFDKYSNQQADNENVRKILDHMRVENDLFNESQSEESAVDDFEENINMGFEGQGFIDFSSPQPMQLISESIEERIKCLSERDDYNFFATGKNNAWAGIEFWKKSTAFQITGEKMQRKKKETAEMVLDAKNIMDKNEVLLQCKKGYPNYFTDAIVKKNEENNTKLPEDFGFSLGRLTQLFSRPRTHVKYVKNADEATNVIIEQEAEIQNEEQAFFAENTGEAVKADENMRFATVSKTVDIKKLKDVMWKSIGIDYNKENASLSVKGNRFSSILESLPKLVDENMLSSLSMHTCFIALLHLANEHGLVLKPEGLCDFFISSGRY
jgi:condensin complex subunit 2